MERGARDSLHFGGTGNRVCVCVSEWVSVCVCVCVGVGIGIRLPNIFGICLLICDLQTQYLT